MKKVFVLWITVLVLASGVSESLALPVTEADPIIVTALRLDQEEFKVAGNVSVITSEHIKNSKAQSVPELLEQVEGVFVYDFSTTRTSSFDIRGFGDASNRNVLVLVDGRRLNAIDSGAADLVQIPVDAVERIEIIRGASSVLYGDNAVGGVVNIVTKKGEEGFHGKLGATLDSYSSRGQHVELSGREKKLSYYVFGKYLDKRGYRDNSDELYKDFNGRLDYEVTEKTSLGIQYGYHEDSYELPGGLNQTELVTLGRTGSAEDGDVATTKDQYVKLSMNIDPLPEDLYLGHIVVDATWRDRKLFDIINAFNFITNRDVTSKGLTAKYIFDQNILGRKVDFVSGIDFYDHDNDIMGSGVNSDDLTISREDIGVYTNLQTETLDNLYLIGGIRYNKTKYTFDQRSGTPSVQEQKPSETVYSAGLKYEYTPESNIHFNYQQTFRFLTTNEWYSSFSGLNTNLEQQTGDQFEFGIKHKFGDKAVVSATPYWIETENEIFFDPNNGFFGSNSNYDKIRRLGIEVGSRFDILEFTEHLDFLDKFEYFANYTYQEPEFKDGANDGNEVPFVPNHQANTGVAFEFLDYYKASFLGRYVGSRFAINDTGNQLPPAKSYVVADFNLSYNREHFELFMKINNIFDKEYETYHATNNTLTVRDVFPAPERHYLWGMNLKF